jgi:hypothetical protein
VEWPQGLEDLEDAALACRTEKRRENAGAVKVWSTLVKLEGSARQCKWMSLEC